MFLIGTALLLEKSNLLELTAFKSLPGKRGFMSTLINFSIFPLDKGESVSVYVARVLEIVRDSGLAYKLNSMGTALEGEWNEVMGVVTRCFEETLTAREPSSENCVTTRNG